MPRNVSGVFSLVPGTDAVPNQVIKSADYNSRLNDIAADLNAARPVVAGGTGATTPGGALTNLGVSTFAQTVLDDADAAAARATLGIKGYRRVTATNNTSTSTGSVIPIDNTTPQNTEGIGVVSATITPTLATNIIRCSAVISVGASSGATLVAVGALFLNSATSASITAVSTVVASGVGQVIIEYEFAPASVTAQTVSIRVGPASGTLFLNRQSSSDIFSGTLISSLFLEDREI